MNATLKTKIAATPERSAWARGVKTYALELVESATESGVELTRENALEALLNGAADWRRYSEGGCSLIYDADIAARLCTPSELKRTRHGEGWPNGRETWLDCQARALSQAFALIFRNLPKY